MPSPSHSRLTIGPSGGVYLFVLAASMVAAHYTQANLMFLVVGMLLGALLISLLWVWLTMRGIELERQPIDHGVTGDELVMRYLLTNQAKLPAFSLVLTETWSRRRDAETTDPLRELPPRLLERPSGWVMHLGPGQSVQAQTACWPMRRGDLTLSHVALHSDFPFGLVRRVIRFDQPGSVLVLPRLYRVTRGVMTKITRLDAGGYHQLDKEGGSEEFFALRDYRMGDSLKVIDWKHSAKIGKLVSRELTQPVPPSLVIYLDLSEYAPARAGEAPPTLDAQAMRRVDRAVDLSASLVCDAYQAGYRVGLIVNGADVPPMRAHHSLPHRGRLLEALARLTPGSAPALQRYTGEAPSVIIRPGRTRTQAVRSGRRAVVLSGEDLESLCIASDSRNLLAARTSPTARRLATPTLQSNAGKTHAPQPAPQPAQP